MKKLLVSPITRAICNKMLQNAVHKTALYSLAKKQGIHIWELASSHKEALSEGDVAHNDSLIDVGTLTVGGEATYIPTPHGYGRVFPWPDSIVRLTTDIHATDLEKNLDSMIVFQAANHTKAIDRIPFKKCLTLKMIREAVQVYDKTCGVYYGDSDGKYLLCVTSHGRIETGAFTREGGGWEDEMLYMDYFNRKLYPGEYGRLKLDDRLYVVFLTVLDDRMRVSALLAPDALTVTPLEDNLHATFRRTPAGEDGQQRHGVDVGYEMKLGAVADLTRCVFFEATKAVGK